MAGYLCRWHHGYARGSVEKLKKEARRGGSIDGQVHVHQVRVEPLEECEFCWEERKAIEEEMGATS